MKNVPPYLQTNLNNALPTMPLSVVTAFGIGAMSKCLSTWCVLLRVSRPAQAVLLVKPSHHLLLKDPQNCCIFCHEFPFSALRSWSWSIPLPLVDDLLHPGSPDLTLAARDARGRRHEYDVPAHEWMVFIILVLRHQITTKSEFPVSTATMLLHIGNVFKWYSYPSLFCNLHSLQKCPSSLNEYIISCSPSFPATHGDSWEMIVPLAEGSGIWCGLRTTSQMPMQESLLFCIDKTSFRGVATPLSIHKE